MYEIFSHAYLVTQKYVHTLSRELVTGVKLLRTPVDHVQAKGVAGSLTATRI